MKIRIFAIGSIKEPWIKKGLDEFCKRIKRFSDIEICELQEFPDSYPIARILQKEEKEFRKRLSDKDYCIALDLKGKKMSSEGFAKFLSSAFEDGGSTVNFLIGGSNGFSEGTLMLCRKRVSMGDMTFPHQIARLLLTEQIFRAFKIIKGERYHK